MSGIRSRNTSPELIVRRGLYSIGFRYRLHRKDIPGTPDIVLSKYKAVIFVHGCFWHGHDCHLFKVPATRTQFWIKKIQANRNRDNKNMRLIIDRGWRVCIVWECALRGRAQREMLPSNIEQIGQWILSEEPFMQIDSDSSYRYNAVRNTDGEGTLAAESPPPKTQ